MRLGFSILLAVLAMLVVGRVGLAETPRVSTLEINANAAVAQLKTALVRERKTRDEQALLANRIAALKRDSSSNDALLERLLRESIDADKALAAQIKETRRSEQAVSQAIVQIDALLSSSRTILTDESKATAARKQAAKEINELRAVKSRLGKILASLKRGEPHREWADHVVAIDPLDGPAELADKTDVLALTQKKIEQKKQQLAQLIREKKVSQAARDFAVDATTFDEDLRTGRVQRREQPEGPEDTLAVGDFNNRAPPAAPAESADDIAQEAQPGLTDTAPPPADPNRDGAFAGTQPQVGAPGRKTVQVSPPTALPSITVAKQIDPNDMINLRVDAIDPDAVDVSLLEKYIAELESMQKALKAQEQKIKTRSQQLQKDEARTKSK